MASAVDDIGSSSSEASDVLDLDGDEGWEDMEPDVEKVRVISLFGEDDFPDVYSMLRHCREAYDFDLLTIRDKLALDFLETIKLVNYIRSEVKVGNQNLRIESKGLFEDDHYLQPVLEDDALLYSLDDLNDSRLFVPAEESEVKVTSPKAIVPTQVARVIELEAELRSLQKQFTDHKMAVNAILEERWSSDHSDKQSQAPISDVGMSTALVRDDDSHYFTSYSFNEIHETMLKDTVRTDAYRDFIYEHKQLFQGKVVLDVGCGTGILSMFCARAGARRVIAVDNSNIIDKAREIVFENGLDGIVTCLHGKIEEVTLPVGQVDVIVSEWMGYCLLYEAMLDSVLWARDRYLAPGGIMVPSHTTLHIAPLSDPDYIADRISFWRSVYGFSMKAMLANIYDEVLIRDLKSSLLPADSQPFLHLSLRQTRKEELTFKNKTFIMEIKEDIDSLDGFVIWFDTFFLPSNDDIVSEDVHADRWTQDGGKGVAFTTGPAGPETHWRQGTLLIDYGKREAKPLKKGQVIVGEIGYQKRKDNLRELDIEIQWKIDDSGEEAKQIWFMR